MSKNCDVHKKERETTGTESVPIPYRYIKKKQKKDNMTLFNLPKLSEFSS